MGDDIVQRMQTAIDRLTQEGTRWLTIDALKDGADEIERLRAAGDQLVDALKHARDPGPVAAYKSAAALAEWERIRNG